MPTPSPEDDSTDGGRLSRRRLLQLSGGAVVVTGIGSTGSTAAAAETTTTATRTTTRCPDATYRPKMVHYDDSIHRTCGDSEATRLFQRSVRRSFERNFPTVGALIDAGFIPYFDFFAAGDTSHWINPRWIGNGGILDASRPESVIVDHEYWRPIGAMFIATRNGNRIDPPPSVYDDDGRECRPWHTHVGFPGRYAWWKYRLVYDDYIRFPCDTPWMMHVWRYGDPADTYDHAPSADGGGPAEPAGFDTEADPREETLGPEHLPDAVRELAERLW
ncbi:hypothetical protein [Haloarchaeobius litoreus]|uniref:TAT (Twin-arginine translocation) pathway signal sequence n=1 Tax=Haloarchaeobius litoreus TaxID=755306 RepID=A0ABD6DJW5_9EURY|nr:hypothetical protein [Haloarchaeobius litoreus]